MIEIIGEMKRQKFALSEFASHPPEYSSSQFW
jgi:hypothetical protein